MNILTNHPSIYLNNIFSLTTTDPTRKNTPDQTQPIKQANKLPQNTSNSHYKNYLKEEHLYKISLRHLQEVGCVGLKPEDLDVEVKPVFHPTSNHVEETLVQPGEGGGGREGRWRRKGRKGKEGKERKGREGKEKKGRKGMEGKERNGREGKERNGREGKERKGRKGKEWKGRKGKEWKGRKGREGKERKGRKGMRGEGRREREREREIHNFLYIILYYNIPSLKYHYVCMYVCMYEFLL